MAFVRNQETEPKPHSGDEQRKIHVEKYVLALDQGTTSSRAILFDHAGQPVGIAQHPFRQICEAWLGRARSREIASSQLGVITEVLVSSGVSPEEIDSIGVRTSVKLRWLES